jgi:L-fuconolactonase
MVFVPGLVPQLDEIATRQPGIRLVLDRSAQSVEMWDDVPGPALEPALAASRYPNIAVKAPAMPCCSIEEYSFRTLHRHSRHVVDAFGPRRVLWGTDLARLRCPYRPAMTLLTEGLDPLSGDDEQRIMGRGIAERLGWPLPRNYTGPVDDLSLPSI